MPAPTFLDLARSIDPTLTGSINYPYRTLSALASAISVSDVFLEIDATANAVVATLPSAVTVKKGLPYWVIRKDSVLTNAVTIATVGGQTINGAASVSITTQYGVLQVVSDGANWLLFASPAAFALATDVLWTFADQVAVGQDSDLYTLVAARAMAFVGVDAKLNVAPTGGSLIVDWEVNGVVDANLRTTVPAGSTFVTVLFPFALAIGDTLHPTVPQVGSLTPGFTMLMRARGQ